VSALGDLLGSATFQRSQYWPRPRVQRAIASKLRSLVEHAYRTVPFYRERFDAAGLRPEDIREPADLRRLPLTRRADLQNAGDAALSNAFSRDSLVAYRSTGSTGRPLTVFADAGFRRAREAFFLRALAAAGYRPGHKLLLVSQDRPRAARRLLRWHYASILDAPDQLLSTFERVRPDILYGCTTPLRQLAERVRAHGVGIPRPRSVISVAESLDSVTRRQFQETFQAEVFDFYGMTEAGIIGFECRAHAGYHVADDAMLVEVEAAEPDEPARLVITNLVLRAMPLIRFDTGDLAVPGPARPCKCGRTLARLERIEGRSADCIRLTDGRVLSPYHLTCAIEGVVGVGRYQVIQSSPERFTVRVEEGGGAAAAIPAAIRAAVLRVVGEGAEVNVACDARLEPAPGHKFRVVECRLGAESRP
jgi:phenylacetate-CoA ligase